MMGEQIGGFELNRIYQQDCIEGMRLLPDKSVDLIVIDPPYNIGKDKRWDKYKASEYLEFMTLVFKECERVLKDNGSFYWFHNDIEQVTGLVKSIYENTSFVYKAFITVDKSDNSFVKDLYGSQNHFRNYINMAEYCLFYTFQDETGLTRVKHSLDNFTTLRNYFRDFQKALGTTKKSILETVGQRADHCFRWSSSQWDLPTLETYEMLSELPRDESFVLREYEDLRREYEDLRREYEDLRYTFNKKDGLGNVWKYSFTGEKRYKHPTQKPLKLIADIIEYSSNPDDVILDCFMGSGTTAVASKRLGRKFIGFEREPEYINIANKRLKEETHVKSHTDFIHTNES